MGITMQSICPCQYHYALQVDIGKVKIFFDEPYELVKKETNRLYIELTWEHVTKIFLRNTPASLGKVKWIRLSELIDEEHMPHDDIIEICYKHYCPMECWSPYETK